MPHFAALVTCALILLACLGYGAPAVRLLRVPAGEPLRPLYAAALGMGTLAYLILAAGLLGWMRLPVLLALAAGGWLLAFLARAQWLPVRGAAGYFPADSLGRLAVAYCALLAAATLLSALRPVDGLDWDSLSYHLAAPRIYLREGRIPFIGYDSHTHFPFTMEMLYSLGLAFGGHGGAKLLHWAAGWLTALALGVWTARLRVGGAPVPGWAGPTAAAVFASMPLVLWEMGTAYVDLGTAFFQLLALIAVVEGFLARDSGADGGRCPALAGAALGGVLSGFALGTKYTALLQFGLLGLGILAAGCRPEGTRGGGLRAALAPAALFGLAGVVVASPWYLKNWLWVRNPVYPFYFHLFPGSYSWDTVMETAYANEQKMFGLGPSPVELLKQAAAAVRSGRPGEALAALAAAAGQAVSAPWNLAVHGRAFYITHRTLVGDKLGSLGPVWAGLLPLLLWCRGLDGRARACLAYAGGSVAAWLFMTQQARYLVPVFAPLAVALAALLAALPAGGLRRAGGGFVAASLLLNGVMHAELTAASARLVLGGDSVREHLAASLQGLYEASEFVNTLPPDARVALYQETRGYYIDRRYFWANPGQHRLIDYDAMRSGDELIAALRRFGITHALINFEFSRDVQLVPWFRLLLHAIQQGRLVQVFRSPSAEFGRRGVMVYELR